ncbi:hypothetical protein BH18ACT15_BH18ACT15_13690 [soil metagenome]
MEWRPVAGQEDQPVRVEAPSKVDWRGAESAPSPVRGSSSGGQGQDLREYFAILRSRKWTILLMIILVTGITILYTIRQVPTYVSSARVLVTPVADPTTSASNPAAQPTLNMDTESQVASSADVSALASEKLGQDVTSLGSAAVSAETGTEVLLFDVASTDPESAQKAAQVYASAYLDYRRQLAMESYQSASKAISDQLAKVRQKLAQAQRNLATTTDEGRQQELRTKANSYSSELALLQQERAQFSVGDSVRVGQIIESASLPSAPSSPSYPRNIVLGVFVGLILGLSIAFLRERLDDRVKGRSDLEAVIGEPVLAVVPTIRAWKKRKRPFLVTVLDSRSVASEAYRTLRTALLFAASRSQLQIVMVTSAQAQEGKTATSANLGVTLAQAGKRTIVVTADLRRPRLEAFFDRSTRMGLTNVLAGELELDKAIVQTNIPSLLCLPSGTLPGNPAEMLSSEAMEKLLAELRQRADFIILDTTPVLAAADALTLVTQSDGVLLVVDGSNTSRTSITHAIESLSRLEAPVIGAVLNNFDASKAGAYHPAYDAYAPPAKPPKTPSSTATRAQTFASRGS